MAAPINALQMLADYYYAAELGFPIPGAAPQLYRGIDSFITALRGPQETGRVTFKKDPYLGILVLLDDRAVGVVALEQGETREMLYARVDELLNQQHANKGGLP
jgi:hypothetical protein